MKNTPQSVLLKQTLKLCFILFMSVTIQSYAQISIVEIKAVYKSKEDGRIISEKEFQSFKGTHTLHKVIKGKKGKDTIIISPPNNSKFAKVTGDHSAFKSLLGKPSKPFTVTDINGNTYNSEALKGKVIVINYWFVACPPCIKEIPHLNNIVKDYGHKDIVFLGFSKDTPELLNKFLDHTQFDFKIIPDASSEAKKNSVSAYPSTMVIDKKGIVRYTGVGLEKNSITKLKYHIQQALK